MRVLFVTQYYAPEPVPKVALLAEMLAKRGHQVTVLTGFPCYPEGRIHSLYSGKIFLRENLNGIEVVRVPQIPDHSSNAFRRMVYYLAFPIFGLLGLLTLITRRFDVCYFYASAVPILALAPVVRCIFGIRCLFDVADLWPESVESSGLLRPRALGILHKFCGLLYRRADHLGAVTQGYKERLMGHGIPSNKISVTYYCLPEFPPVPCESRPNSTQFVVTFTGMIGRPQNLDVMLDAAKILLQRNQQIVFYVAGSGMEYESLVSRAAVEKISNVTFLGRLPASEMPRLYAQSDALLVHLKPDTLSTITIPSKTYGYLAAGKPILMAVDGEASRFIEEHQCGLRVKAGDAPALAAAILKLSSMASDDRNEIGKNSRKLFEAKFSVERHIRVWEDLLHRFCFDQSSPSRKVSASTVSE